MKVLSKNNKVLLADGQAVKWQSGGVEQVTWHQCPEAPRNFVNDVTYDPNTNTMSCMGVSIEVDPSLSVDQNLEGLYEELMNKGFSDGDE